MSVSRAPVPIVVQQHADEAVALRNTRSYLLASPHVRLHQLRRLDDRLAAHLDGLAIAGEYGSRLAQAVLANPGVGEAFAATVRAIEDRDAAGLERLLALVEAQPDGQRGLISAFGWVSAASLRGISKALLESSSTFRRQVGFATCAMHQVDPGAAATSALNDADMALRARALRVAADRGRIDLRQACADAMADEDAGCAYEAARASVLLGDRRAAMTALATTASQPGPWRARSLALVLKLCAPADAMALLKPLSQDSANVRLLIRGVGIAGDPTLVPWLIQQMPDMKLTRLAGESFSLITGLDLAALDLEHKAPDNIEAGPNDSPADEDVSADEDDGLPWPDPVKISDWWQAHGHRFAPGTRYFMGEPPSPAHCLAVLRTGFQRQRIAAAEYLSLLTPGTPLFNCAAPAWRQQRWLAAMGG